MIALLATAFGALAALCWVVAVVGWILAVRHRQPDQTLSSHLFGGFKAFNPDNFTDEGKRYQRVFLYGVAGFFASVLVGVLLSVLAS